MTTAERHGWLGWLRHECGPKTGPPVLYHGGLACSVFGSVPMLEALGEQGYRAVGWSLPCHDGNETLYHTMTASCLITGVSRRIRELSDTEDGRPQTPVVLIGFSLGSIVNAVAAAKSSDRVRGVVLLSGCPVPKSYRQAALLGALRFLGHTGLYRFGYKIRMPFGRSSEGDGMTDEYRVQPRFDFVPLGGLVAFAQVQAAAQRALLGLRCPVHFVHGDLDRRTPSQSILRFIERRKRAGLETRATILPNAPHSLMFWERRADFVEAVRNAVNGIGG